MKTRPRGGFARHALGLLVFAAACSPFAAGDDDAPATPNPTNEAGATSGGDAATTTDGGADGSTSADATSEAVPAVDPLFWEGDEVATWIVSNVSPVNAGETNDCCGGCVGAACNVSDVSKCNDTTARAGNGIGTFASGPPTSAEHKKDGVFASRHFTVEPGASYDVRFRFTRLSAFGPGVVSAQYKVTLYDGTMEVNSKTENLTCASGAGCADISTSERMFITSSFMNTANATIVIKLFGDASCNESAGVTFVQADVDYVRLLKVQPH